MPTTIQLPATGGSTVPPRRRRVTRYAVVVGAVLVLGVSALTIANQALTKHDDQTQFTADGVRELVINQDAGDITLLAGSTAGQVRVITSRSWSWQQPRSTHTVKDGILTLTGESPSFPRLGTSDVDQEVTVPHGVTVRVDVNAGNIHATGLDAPDFQVKTDSGNIDATDLDVTFFAATTSSGNIHASLYGATERVKARTSAGSVELTVPDATYNVDADTSSGQVRIQVTDEPNAPRLISAHTSSGDVSIRGR
jgi:Putative adhesin